MASWVTYGLRHGSLSPDLTMELAADAAAGRVLKAQQPGPEKPRKLRRGSLRIFAYTTAFGHCLTSRTIMFIGVLQEIEDMVGQQSTTRTKGDRTFDLKAESLRSNEQTCD